MFYVTPLLILCFEQKGGEEYVFIWVYFYPFVDDWQKGGEEFEFVVYMHVCVCMFYAFIKVQLVSKALFKEHVYFWYQELH